MAEPEQFQVEGTPLTGEQLQEQLPVNRAAMVAAANAARPVQLRAILRARRLPRVQP